MSAEDALELFKAMAEIHGTESRIKVWPESDSEKIDSQIAEEVNAISRHKAKTFTFSSVDIQPGETVVFIKEGNEFSGTEVTVIDDKHVSYKRESWTLTGLAIEFIGRNKIPGPDFFKYKGKWLNDIRREKGIINF